MAISPDEHFARTKTIDGEQPANRLRIPTGMPDPIPPPGPPLPPLEDLPEPPSAGPPAGIPADILAVKEPHLLELLREVIDPELGVDIISLGLVRDARTDGRTAHVTFAVTMPGCPMREHLENEIRRVLLEQAEIDEAVVNSVDDPPWTAADMEETVRTKLGWKP